MKKTILYIFDEFCDPQRVLDSIDRDESRILMISLTADEEKVDQVKKTLYSSMCEELVRVPFARYFNKKAFEIKDDFVRFVADFSRCNVNGRNLNLKEYFKWPFSNFSVWWFSLISEKNTLKTRSFHRLVKLLTLKELLEEYKCRKVLLDISDRKFVDAIKNNVDILGISCIDFNGYKKTSEFISIFKATVLALKYFCVWFIRSIFAKYKMIDINNHKKFLKKSKFLLVTYFPNLDEERLKNGKFINRYYEPLQRALEQKYSDSFAWLAMTVSHSKYTWRESFRLGPYINKCGNKFMFFEEWVEFSDLLKVSMVYIYFSIKYFFCLSWLSKNFKYPEGNLNIWELFKEDWHNSFCGYSLIEGSLYYRVFSNIFSHLDDGAKIMYFAEMHGWEKALNIASNNNGKIKTIGIQHTIVSLLFLMYFNDRVELEDGDYIQKMPKPDYLGCVGEIPLKLFRDSGWRENRTFSWGPLRFQHFRYLLNNMVSWQKRKNRIVIALSIMPELSKEMLLYVYYAFKTATGFEVFIKSHPFLSINKLIHTLEIEFNEEIFTISDMPLGILLQDAKAVIAAESSASLEAIASGCTVIIPRFLNVVDMNPMSGLSDLQIYVESPYELRDVVEKILKKEEAPFSTEQYKDFIVNYCNPLDSDNDFLRKLEELAN